MLLNRSTTRKFLLPTPEQANPKSQIQYKHNTSGSASALDGTSGGFTAYGEVVLHMAVSTMSSEECSTNWWMKLLSSCQPQHNPSHRVTSLSSYLLIHLLPLQLH